MARSRLQLVTNFSMFSVNL